MVFRNGHIVNYKIVINESNRVAPDKVESQPPLLLFNKFGTNHEGMIVWKF